ncbi:MAG: YicC family protein [Firmicutes bacterium]|nr:YicC family protein [Clostridiales bacterium]MBQ4339969.1 YicC family protein [Bacillota bacterium]
MVKSMTGFGRSEYNDGKRNIIVEIKSVNHRYCDISVKMPRRYSFAEEKIKSIVKETAKRGKIDVSIMVENITEDDTNIKLNTALAAQYYERLKELKETFSVEGEITLQFLSGLPDVMKAIPDVEDEEEIINTLSVPVREAAQNHDAMRIVEGKKLADDIIKRGRIIAGYVEEVNSISEKVTQLYRDKLRDRIKELVGNSVEIPEERIITEAAIFADKSNVTEELVRLDSHIKQLEDIISNSTQPDGKKLDFIVQEMNREANTTGSKSADIGITNIVVEMKSEIEKIREQVQNIE